MPEHPRPYSDATLDALAAGPTIHVTLPDAIALHRALWILAQ